MRSVAPVATAIPAFIGCTEAGGTQAKPVHLTSLLEFERLFGKAPVHNLSVSVTRRVDSAGVLLGVTVTWNGPKPALPTAFLYYSMQLYFANGGGLCHVYSIDGVTGSGPRKEHYTAALDALEAVDEVTLLVFPDAVTLTATDYCAVADAALASCKTMRDRFVVLDVPNAVSVGTSTNQNVTDHFRSKLSSRTVDLLQYGAAYFPYIETDLPFHTADSKITLASCKNVTVAANGDETITDVPGVAGRTLDADLKVSETDIYDAVKAFAGQAWVTLPPSGAIAGAYARVDRTRGVWKAPANVDLVHVVAPAVSVTNELQAALNVDVASGKSVNAIRSFPSKGTLIWGARTLAGNDNEWRYVSVRRFATFVEESVRKALGLFVAEPNNAATWGEVRTIIESFLMTLWLDGALMGAKPEHAFGAVVGLGQTMSQQDVLAGRMMGEVHLAVVRPAEFIILRLVQQMPQP